MGKRGQNPPAAGRLGPRYSSSRSTSSSWGLCFRARPVLGSVSTTRDALGWPTRSRALAFTALVTENLPGLRFFIAPRLAYPSACFASPQSCVPIRLG